MSKSKTKTIVALRKVLTGQRIHRGQLGDLRFEFPDEAMLIEELQSVRDLIK